MQTRMATTLLISLLSSLTSPVLAESLLCPQPAILPPALNIQTEGSTAQVRQLQIFLGNIRRITHVYSQANSFAMKDQLTNCLMDHLATLPDNASLQSPQTRADGASWFLMRDEVRSALQITAPNLRFKPQLPAIMAWLNTIPQYHPTTLATR